MTGSRVESKGRTRFEPARVRCSATVPARWHTPAHQCTFEAVHDGLCAKHLTRPEQIQLVLAKLEKEERELIAMLKRTIDGVRKDIAKRKAELHLISPSENPGSATD